MTETDKQRLTDIMLSCLGKGVLFIVEGDYIEVSRCLGMDDDFSLTYDYSDNEMVFSNCKTLQELKGKLLHRLK